MQNIQAQLKDMLLETMIPESEDFIRELQVLVDNETATEDDLDAIAEMKSFLEELQSINKAIDDKVITDDEAQGIYDKIETMINEHQD